MDDVETLTHQELLVLAGLLRVLVLVDREVDGYELDALDRVGDRVATAGASGPLGTDGFRLVFGEANRALPDRASVRAAAEGLTRPAAREAIYAIVRDVALANGIVREEQALLDWLEERWELVTDAAET